jgi:CubicO group peptidase (beta-lactamase class C family)
MCQLIPEDFVLQSAYATTHITLEDCLSHRTGMPSHHADLGGHSVKENTRNLRHLAMSQELRTTWQYSNHMYWAVSRMIEVHCGMELGRFLKEKLWKPLSMDTTFLSIKDAQEYVNQKEGFDMAKPHMWDEEANDFKILPYWDDVGISGAGAVVSNVVDYAKWIRSFITQAGPLSAAGYSAVASPHMIMPPISPRFTGPICYGFGWWISAYHGERVLFHPGGLIGFTASMICLPDKKWGAVGMCNGTSDAALDAPLWHLVDEFLGVPQNERTDVVAQYVFPLA